MISISEYERLLQYAADNGIYVNETILREDDNLSGLYIRFSKTDAMILINSHRTIAQKTVTILEELAHHEKTVGQIIDQGSVENRKAERVARDHVYRELAPRLITAIKNGYYSLCDISEETDIPETTIVELFDFCSRKGIDFNAIA